ncbi:MAG: O-antigen ligase family protein [Desulfovibrionales bacterium]|nr:O-antigen ligase family protein [Desulfovibrionales bacterium]
MSILRLPDQPGSRTGFFTVTVLFLALLCLNPSHAEVSGVLAAVLGAVALGSCRAAILWREPLVWLVLGFGVFSTLVLAWQGKPPGPTAIIYGWLIPLTVGKILAHFRGPALHTDLLFGTAALAAVLLVFALLPFLGLSELGSIRLGTADLTYTFRNQTRTALFACLAALIALTHTTLPRRLAALALASCAVLLPIMVLAGKRMTLAAFLASSAFYALVRYRFRARTVAVLGLVVLSLGGLIAVLDTGHRFDLTPAHLLPSQGVQERAAVWYAAGKLFQSAPLTGTGFRTFQDAAAPHVAAYRAAHPGTHDYENLGDAHNIILHLLAESGLVGLALFSAMLIIPLARAWKLRHTHPAALCLAACLVLVLLNFQLHMHLTAYNVSTLLFFFLGLAQGLTSPEDATPC